ncbi:MAG: transcription antitermination factor NusB [Cyclobacteriaceae bacterium]
MLNRRTLRIKVMQSLFAYEQCSEADFELAKEYLVQKFSPDLNSMEVQDKELLKSRQQAALVLIDRKHHGSNSGSNQDSSEPIVEEEVNKALAQYTTAIDADLRYFKKETVSGISDLEDEYHSILILFPALAVVAAAEKLINHKNFTTHSVVKAIAADKELSGASKNSKSGWDSSMDVVRSWFREIIRTDEKYQEFIAIAKPSIDEELGIIRHLLRKLILGDSVIGSYFEAKHLRWTEDKEIIRGLVEKTLKTIRGDQGFQVQKLSLEWEEDKFFVEKLFETAARLPERFHKLIASNTVNWEVERLPLTDRIIIQMAITEFITFPSVPIKVTINEYIELAKDYSTPKSRQFINGILDVLARELKKSGDLKKTGRGLIDNK